MMLPRCFKNRPLADLLGYTLILIAAPIIYIYGGFCILPIVLTDTSPIVQFLAVLLATWIFIGILANLQLVQSRHSTIREKVLADPVIVGTNQNENGAEFYGGLRQRSTPPTSDSESNANAIGQQFLAAPFGSEIAWHICSKCETYVPPRAWHCNVCKVCVLRRDHHCIFAMSCIGLENHGNFIGLLFYLSAGTIYATVVLMSYAYIYIDEEITIPWLIFRSGMPLYMLIFDPSVHNLITSFCFICSTVSTGIFLVYFVMSWAGETSGDRKRKQNPKSSNLRYRYKNLKDFLGPSPMMRILWPFHKKLQF